MKSQSIRQIFVLSLFVSTFLAQPAAAETKTFSSGEKRATLVELFTSQGCSSCPPAERWLNSLAGNPDLWSEIVPVAFHVDYWDRLGWADPYASEAFTQRQYSYRETGSISSVYTPSFVVDGGEWRGWFQGRRMPKADGKSARLTATLAGDQMEVMFEDPKPGLELNVVVLGFGIATDVSRGENRGRTLKQDFVVLSHDRLDGEGGWNYTLPVTDAPDVKKRAVALWVTGPGSTMPLQATGGWL